MSTDCVGLLVQIQSVQTFGRKVCIMLPTSSLHLISSTYLTLNHIMMSLDDYLTVLYALQKTAVAVAYVKAGSGLLKLNGEQSPQQLAPPVSSASFPACVQPFSDPLMLLRSCE